MVTRLKTLAVAVVLATVSAVIPATAAQAGSVTSKCQINGGPLGQRATASAKAFWVDGTGANAGRVRLSRVEVYATDKDEFDQIALTTAYMYWRSNGGTFTVDETAQSLSPGWAVWTDAGIADIWRPVSAGNYVKVIVQMRSVDLQYLTCDIYLHF